MRLRLIQQPQLHRCVALHKEEGRAGSEAVTSSICACAYAEQDSENESLSPSEIAKFAELRRIQQEQKGTETTNILQVGCLAV